MPDVLDKFRRIAEERLPSHKALSLPERHKPHTPFIKSLEAKGSRALILEHKRASPSHGLFEGLPSLQDVIARYESQGAAALSILTEETGFQGNLQDLHQASTLTELPLLRKDFLVDPYEVKVAHAYGADAILVIVAMLSDAEIKNLLNAAKEYQIDVLVEVHNQEELDRALKFDIELLGVNNRDLKTLKTDTTNYVTLLEGIPSEMKTVAESGYDSLEDIAALPERTTAVLAGTSFLLRLCQS